MTTETSQDVQANGAGASPLAPVPKGLAAKLVEAALDVETVQKRGENKAQGYRYATAEDVIATATKALLARQILVDFEPLNEVHFAKDNGGFIAIVTGRLILTDAETGESLHRAAMGSGADKPGDKAISKAMTGARKYSLLHLLGIPIGDDPDAETRREQIAHTQGPKLDPERVKQITEAFHERKLRFADIDLLLGSVGIDALRAHSKKAAKERIESLTEEQAIALEAELTKE